MCWKNGKLIEFIHCDICEFKVISNTEVIIILYCIKISLTILMSALWK